MNKNKDRQPPAKGLLGSYSAEGEGKLFQYNIGWRLGFRPFQITEEKSLEKGLTSERFEQFLGAMFELEIHEILRRLGCVIEIEPELPGSNGTVGFRVIDNSQEFYVEATVCGIGQGKLRSNENEHDAVEKLRKNLKRLHSDLCLEAEGEVTKSLGKTFVNPFQKGIIY